MRMRQSRSYRPKKMAQINTEYRIQNTGHDPRTGPFLPYWGEPKTRDKKVEVNMEYGIWNTGYGCGSPGHIGAKRNRDEGVGGVFVGLGMFGGLIGHFFLPDEHA